VASPAIDGGGILVQGGKIGALLSAAEAQNLKAAQPQLPHEHLPGAVLTPGLFNLHTHLDYTNLAHLEAFNGESMFDWLEDLVSQSRSTLNTAEMLGQSALAGARQAALAGTSFVVDSTFSGAPAQALAEVGLKGLVGLELFGLDSELADLLFDLWQERLAKLTATAGSALQEALQSGRVRLTIAPHAPYTVAPALWLKAKHWAKERGLPLTCHLAESDNEFNWIKNQDDRLDQYLLKVMPKNPTKSSQDALKDLETLVKSLPWRGSDLSPCAHLYKYELLDEGTIAAHCLKLSPEDIKLLADQRVKVALCPRSNNRLNNGLPQPQTLIDSGITCGLGTDSRASSPSLCLLEEAHYLHSMLLASNVLATNGPATNGPATNGPATNGPATIGAATNDQAPDYKQLLSMLTLGGAKAVGLDERTGSLEVGKCADIAAFDLSNRGDGGSDTGRRRPINTANPATPEQALAALFETSPACLLLLVDGKAVVRDGRLV
jgi:5-methylthioadenosine/S-adenosylhomocysteine deaminase